MTRQSIHYDACMILGKLRSNNDHDERTICNDAIRKGEKRKKEHDFELKISLVAIGEVLIKCNKDDLYEVYDEISKMDTPVPDVEVMKTAIELKQKDPILKPADALIVAQAICDDSATWLMTIDKHILFNNAIDEIIQHRERRLTISNSFGN